jgi:uncharacterized protein (TIGR00296 family)
MEVALPEEVSQEDGAFLVRLARKAVEEYVKNKRQIVPPSNTPKELWKFGASFVTLLKLVGDRTELRGCIGYTAAFQPLVENVISAAIAAATQDPRFPPVKSEELKRIIVEVSVLSPLIQINKEDIMDEFLIGRDGLFVKRGLYTGLLLPEVPVEYCWDKETFLCETCMKAGLRPDCWLDEETEIYRFSARTFRETHPGGDVVERDLRAEYERRCPDEVVKS